MSDTTNNNPYYSTSLREYAQLIGDISILTPEKEQELINEYQTTGSERAKKQIIEAHLRLAYSMARKYRGYSSDLEDIVSEANIGLIRALDTYKTDKKTRFSTHAVFSIKASIMEYGIRNWSMVKSCTTQVQRKLFFNLGKVKKLLDTPDTGNLTPKNITEIANLLTVPEHEVITMHQRLSGRDFSLQTPMAIGGEDNNQDGSAHQDVLIDDSLDVEGMYEEHQELSHKGEILQQALNVLEPRERDIFEARYLHEPEITTGKVNGVNRLISEEPKKTLVSIAKDHNISRQRINQIELKAYKKVKAEVMRLVALKQTEVNNVKQ